MPAHVYSAQNLQISIAVHVNSGPNLEISVTVHVCKGPNLQNPMAVHVCSGQNLQISVPAHVSSGRNLEISVIEHVYKGSNLEILRSGIHGWSPNLQIPKTIPGNERPLFAFAIRFLPQAFAEEISFSKIALPALSIELDKAGRGRCHGATFDQ